MREVGNFEVLEKLGAGGMGEVFKARDRRLNRFVALKFLPEAASPEARERFQREAQAVAALNHPHICTLHEVGDDHGRPYLVLELLEGETLRARLARGALAPAQWLDWSTQIADALEAAHKRGVLHRDLKPDNIFVSPSGHIKVLDFGLARLESLETPEAPGGEDKTLVTSPGVTLGTVPYMSPEQARGEPLDARSDLFSFGAVAYEMASGRTPFPGHSAAEVIAGILKEHPPELREARPELPPKIDEVVSRCLEKDPDLRYQSAADLRSELKRLSRSSNLSFNMSTSSAGSGGAAATGGPPSSSAALPAATLSDSQVASGLLRRHWGWPVLAVVVLAACAGLGWWHFASLPVAPAAPAATAPLQFRQLTFSGQLVDAVISPDGKFLAHVDVGPQGTSLHLVSTVSGSDVQIMPPAQGCCESPSFSPDGSEVYFLDGRQLQAIPALGGTARTIAAHACSGAGFSPDGSRIAYLDTVPNSGGRLMLAQADGSQPHVLNSAAAGDGYLSQCWINVIGQPTHAPAWSPDGQWIAVSEGPVSGDPHVVVINASSGQARTIGPALIPTAADINWLPDGSEMILTAPHPEADAPQIWKLSFPDGHLTQLTNDLQGYTAASLASSGQLAVMHAVPQASIWAQARPGGEFQQLPGGGASQDGSNGLSWTPQDGLVSLRQLGGKAELWAENGDGSGAHRLPLDPMPDQPYWPQVAANGQIVFATTGGQPAPWRVNADGSGLTRLVTPGRNAAAYGASPVRGGRDVAYMATSADGSQTLWTVPLAGGAPAAVPHPGWSGRIYAGSGAPTPDGSGVMVLAEDHKMFLVAMKDGSVTPIAYDPKTMSGPFAFGADGRSLIYVQRHGSVDNLWSVPLPNGKPIALTHFTDLNIRWDAVSHDGRLAISRGSPNRDAVVATGIVTKADHGH